MPIETFKSIASAAGHSSMFEPEKRMMSIADLDGMMDARYLGQPTYTGKLVSPSTALSITAVWGSINAKARDIAFLPFLTFQRVEGGQQEAMGHYCWDLLQHQVNPEMTAFRFKHLMMTWLCLWGNAYAEIDISGRGQVVGLYPWRPDRVKLYRQERGGPLYYQYEMDGGGKVYLPHDRVLHLRGLSTDGIFGLSPIEAAKQQLGWSMAMTEHGARYFGNGARPGGIIEVPDKLGDKAIDNLKASWLANNGGLSNAHRLAVLEQGAKWVEVATKMVDAQFLESQNFSVEDIARLYGVPPHRIGALNRSTNNNIEQQALEYIQYSLGPEVGNWINEFEYSLLSGRERSSIYLDFDFTKMLAGDHTSRAMYYTAMSNTWAITPDEIRKKEGYNAYPDGLGKLPRGPMNTERIDKANEIQPAPPQKSNGKPNGIGALHQ